MKTFKRTLILLMSGIFFATSTILAADDNKLIKRESENFSITLAENVTVTGGKVVDVTKNNHADEIMNLQEGTIVISFTSDFNNPVQSLLSVGNATPGNQDRHFHIYVTDTGKLGMELRNTDKIFKYTLSSPAALQGLYHRQQAINTVAFKADKNKNEYKLFANGKFLTSMKVKEYKFLSDITGVNNISLGGTVRQGKVAYPFNGKINKVTVYKDNLNDQVLSDITAATVYGKQIFSANDGSGSNYYRIPAMLTLSDGTVVASADARYGGTHDARSNIDIAFARSVDGGKTFSKPVLPLAFDDYAASKVTWPRAGKEKNLQISGSAAFIDSVLLQDKETKRLFLFADAFTYGKGFNNAAKGSGFKEVRNGKYLKLRWHEDGINEYNYTIRENGIIYDDRNNKPTDYSVDKEYRLLFKKKNLLQKQYDVKFVGSDLVEYRTNIDVKMSVFYKDSVFQLFPTNYMVMKYSDDNGLTWSGMNILGKFRKVDKNMLLFGPGRGTQITKGKYAGRLIITAYNSMTGDYGYLFSDNHGKDWDFINTELGAGGNTAEAQIVELPDGSLRTFMRTNKGKIAYTTSNDGGFTWSAVKYMDNLNVTKYGTQLSVINYSRKIAGQDAIIMSTPAAADGRRNGKILIGLIETTARTGEDKYEINWKYSYGLDLPKFGFSYSCLTELPTGDLGILYEKYDSWSRSELHLSDTLRYETYTLSELMNN